MPITIDERTEWLETDGLGGFACGTTLGIRTRRYHGLLVSATTPPTGRFMLINGLDVRLRTPEGDFPLSFHRYAPGVTNEADAVRVERFEPDPWPRWTYRLDDGTLIEHEVCMTKGSPRIILTWRLPEPQRGVRLIVRPLMSGRDYHALHHENPSFRFDPEVTADGLRWSPYAGVPTVSAVHNGLYRHHPVWYRGFLYDQERERGADFVEDLASPGAFEFELSDGPARMVLASENQGVPDPVEDVLRAECERRRSLGSPLERAADAYLVRRGKGITVIAGYPWFADWGRDTFIALRGLCLATGRFDDARQILLAWAGSDADGVLPNRFTDQGDLPEYNSVDASLWFIVAADELIRECRSSGRPLSASDTQTLRNAMLRIVAGYARGTRHGIRLDHDGLLAAGEPGVQLTWMDARVGARVITPRIGKPVEIQALWLNALRIASKWTRRWLKTFELGLASFEQRFWNEAGGCLYDVIDADHTIGGTDDSLRPNQVLAVGGLPLCLLTPDRARRVVGRVEESLLTPLGLRSLAPDHPDYAPRYRGGPAERDAVYHQGTVWPWLLGPFVEAWLRVHGDSPARRTEARARFLAPLLRHLEQAGLGHISEIADADAPHAPNGCPFQAWSVGEALRLDRRVLARAPAPARQGQRIASAPPRRIESASPLHVAAPRAS